MERRRSAAGLARHGPAADAHRPRGRDRDRRLSTVRAFNAARPGGAAPDAAVIVRGAPTAIPSYGRYSPRWYRCTLRCMKSIVVPYTTRIADARAPLRRSLPAAGIRAATRRPQWSAPLLALAGIALFVDIEFALAYLLHAAARLIG